MGTGRWFGGLRFVRARNADVVDAAVAHPRRFVEDAVVGAVVERPDDGAVFAVDDAGLLVRRDAVYRAAGRVRSQAGAWE